MCRGGVVLAASSTLATKDARKPNDDYPRPSWATLAVIAHLALNPGATIREPAPGVGNKPGAHQRAAYRSRNRGASLANRFDGAMEDVFDLQNKLTTSLAGAIELATKAAETRQAMARPTNDLTAYRKIIELIRVEVWDLIF